MLNEDYSDMLRCLLDEKVEFLLIGAYAMAVYGYPRATKDIDLWIYASPANAPRVIRALERFGAPMQQVTESDFETVGAIFQIGVAPRRIDLTTLVHGPSFDQAWANRKLIEIDGMSVPVIARADLIVNKRATGRPQDLLDADQLEVE
ncbi:MAG: nucleotidyltransferase [Planctomycetota bacterium]